MRDCGNLPSRIRSGFGLASLSHFKDTGATPFGPFGSGIAMLQTVATTRYVHRGLKGPPHPVTVPTNFHRTPCVTRLVYGARATSFEISQSRVKCLLTRPPSYPWVYGSRPVPPVSLIHGSSPQGVSPSRHPPRLQKCLPSTLPASRDGSDSSLPWPVGIACFDTYSL
jgi:hypothetical protein